MLIVREWIMLKNNGVKILQDIYICIYIYIKKDIKYRSAIRETEIFA